jgi:hypothetical protein
VPPGKPGRFILSFVMLIVSLSYDGLGDAARRR